MAENANAAKPAVKEKELTYNVAGIDVTLTKSIVRKLLCRGNADFTDEHINQFMLMCMYNNLNPFLKEAYLTGYKNSKTGESDVSMVMSIEAKLKRAEACQNYEGYESGIIIKRGSDIVELEGAFYLETDVLLGGWAKVYRSDRKKPAIVKVRLADYDKGRSTWNQIKSSMIEKVALSQALTKAFPAQIGAVYSREEERSIEDQGYVEVVPGNAGALANSQALPPETPSNQEASNAPSTTSQPEIPDAFNV